MSDTTEYRLVVIITEKNRQREGSKSGPYTLGGARRAGQQMAKSLAKAWKDKPKAAVKIEIQRFNAFELEWVPLDEDIIVQEAQ